ncbi:hypothetical protein HIM_11252 [Hirsutella minnesotensis 3608]|uniref:Uncharacterized protein n=1 Tax=Hirsutella minnesotensis 3608 TaxID=1043627 RepID=A0A0F7ZFL5_9HYPO|nr:hypothetical protein HIM_11252 [Hirsutella minnesotensis 3608]
MVRQLALLAAGVSCAVALDAGHSSNTTIQVLNVSDGLPKYGSVIGADSKAVTYVATCGRNEGCDNFLNGDTVKQGPTTFSAGQVRSLVGNDGSIHTTNGVECALNSQLNQASCQYYRIETDQRGKVTRSSTNQILTGYLGNMRNVTLTAGVESLTDAPGASPSSTIERTSASDAAPSPSSSMEIAAPTSAAGETSRNPGTSASPLASAGALGSAATIMTATEPAVLAGIIAIISSLLALP